MSIYAFDIFCFIFTQHHILSYPANGQAVRMRKIFRFLLRKIDFAVFSFYTIHKYFNIERVGQK